MYKIKKSFQSDLNPINIVINMSFVELIPMIAKIFRVIFQISNLKKTINK